MRLKKIYLLFTFILIFFFDNQLFAQQNVGIGTATPHASAALEVSANNKGLLIPRLSTAQRMAIDSPANGLMLYDLTSKGFWLYNGTNWVTLAVKESKQRSVYIPANGMSYIPNANISITQYGLNLSGSASEVTFIVPKPVDWDSTQTFTVTLHFSLPTNTTNTFIKWRLAAGGTLVNTSESIANAGWDSYNYYVTEDAALLAAYATSPFGNLAKSQTWTPKWSSTQSTWYFGSSPSVANRFSYNPVWRIGFIRGASVSNGETFPGVITVNGATINYTAK